MSNDKIIKFRRGSRNKKRAVGADNPASVSPKLSRSSYLRTLLVSPSGFPSPSKAARRSAGNDNPGWCSAVFRRVIRAIDAVL